MFWWKPLSVNHIKILTKQWTIITCKWKFRNSLFIYLKWRIVLGGPLLIKLRKKDSWRLEGRVALSMLCIGQIPTIDSFLFGLHEKESKWDTLLPFMLLLLLLLLRLIFCFLRLNLVWKKITSRATRWNFRITWIPNRYILKTEQ